MEALIVEEAKNELPFEIPMGIEKFMNLEKYDVESFSYDMLAFIKYPARLGA